MIGKTVVKEVKIENNRTSTKAVFARALELIDTPNPLPLPAYRSTTRRTISRRGVIWLGQTCNLRCEFCYFITRIEKKDHPEHAFMPLEKAKKICDVLRSVYGNSSVDIEGGEPTIYPYIYELIEYCVKIGLYPTLITNALVLADRERCRHFKDAGIRDFKISIHGLGEIHDKLVGRREAHERQMQALRNMRELGIPFRFNTVLTPAVVPQLPYIARLAIISGALCVNFLGYNPHEDQAEKEERLSLIPNFTEMREPLTRALDILAEAEIEANVRYVPHCMVEERHRKTVYHFQQLFYDHREWDLASWSWTTLKPQRESGGDISDPITLSSLKWWVRFSSPLRIIVNAPVLGKLFSIKRLVNATWLLFVLYKIQTLLTKILPVRHKELKDGLYNQVARLNSQNNCESIYGSNCRNCKSKPICSGIYRDYAALFGTGETRPISTADLITDPLYYISNQRKIVETEDESWALNSEIGT
jgi:MoaA/NifB/PqqE/SkfB family radical SAM enzyme